MMKTYNSIVIIAVCLMVGFCAGLMTWAQPLNGDLTRIGAYPERWFGWNAAQQKIPDSTNTPKSLTKKHLFVIGDSFSEKGYWQSYLTDKYSFTFVHTRNTTLHSVLDRIRREKPDAVVVESVERFTLALLGSGSEFMGNTAKNCSTPVYPTDHSINHPSLATTISYPWFTRKTTLSSAKEISQGLYYVKQRLLFLRKPKKQLATVLDLTTPDLFSNQLSDKLLVINSDLLLLPPFDDTAMHTIQCSINTIANALTEIGIPFTVVLVPDKTTAYQPYLTQENIRNKTAVISRITAPQAPFVIDMLPSIRAALAQGAVDFYLPNDTHWGYQGFQLAASLIDAQLQNLLHTQPQQRVQQP